MTASSQGEATGMFYVAPSLAAALDTLNDYGPDGAAFAGGTWIMRAPIRHQPLKTHYVAIGKIPELTVIRIGTDAIEIGAAVTHAALTAALTDLPEFAVLAAAAGRSANPAIRAMATIGGNLSASDFSAADCVPALLCLDTQVEVSSRDGHERISIDAFLKRRSTFAPGQLLTKIVVPRSGHKTAHSRLPLRKAGDYPVAIVSLSVDVDPTNQVRRHGSPSVRSRWPHAAGNGSKRLWLAASWIPHWLRISPLILPTNSPAARASRYPPGIASGCCPVLSGARLPPLLAFE